METLSTLKKGTGTRVQPYQKPLRLKVVAVKSSREYKPGSKMLAMALADKTDFIRGVCFEEAKFKYLTEGAGVLLSNFSIKNGEISIGSSTKVYSTSPPDVDADISKEAIEMIHPTEPEVVPIQTAKKSPKGKTTSVKGKILSDGAVTTAAIRGNNVNVKTIEVSDGRDKVKVSLWRDLSLSPTKPGDNVKITHLYASNNTYYNDVVLSTTSNSTVAAFEPELEEVTIEIVGCDVGDISTELITADSEIFTIDNSIITMITDIEEFPTTLPKIMRVKVMKNKVEAIVEDSD